MIGHAAESLERLDAAIAALPRRARLPAEAASLRVVRAMGALDAPPALPQPAVLEQVRARLVAGGADGKDIALAPWVLWDGDPPAVGFPGLLDRVVADAGRRRRTLRHLIEAWLKDFRLNASRIADAGLAIERLLAGGANDRLDLWRDAHARYRMFDASTGPEEIARDLIDGDRSPADILAATGLDDETRGIGGYMHAVHDLCLARVAAALAGREVDRKFERAGTILASGERLRFPEARGEIARKLLLPWRDGQAGPGAEAQKLVQAFLLRHIGHPQLEPRAWIAIGAMLKALHALRSCSLHPAPDAAVEDAAFIGASARLIVAFRALDGIAARRERALIFRDDRDMQARLAGLIQRRYRLPLPPMIVNGAVPGPRRQGLVNRFQANDRAFDTMILSPRAGGVGLTLTSANHVIHLDRWWNPAVEDQCTGRVLRIGQVRPVAVHIPLAVCEGKRSFDQNLHALLERKRELFRETLMPAEISEGEALTLVEQSAAGG